MKNKFKKTYLTALATLGVATTFSGPVLTQAAPIEVVSPQYQLIVPTNQPGMGTQVSGNNTNFRVGPGTGYASLGQVHAGQWVSFRYRSGSWTNVRIETGVNQGRTGYIQTNLLNSNWIW